jgi:uncharacterized radical SAM superfamily protein
LKAEEALSPSTSLSEVLEAASRLKGSEGVLFYAPSFRRYEAAGFHNSPHSFPAISVTGPRCALSCEHCKGFILRYMIPATTPEALYRACLEASMRGGVGVLVSGGSSPDGAVPLKPFLPTLAKVKRELGLRVVVHTGLVSEEVARGMAEAGVDAAMMDVVGDEETALKVLHLKSSPADFERSLSLLERYGVPSVPHVVVGLHYGELRGELKALEIISRHSPSAVVAVALNPLLGTGMEGVRPPSPEAVARVLAAARLLMPRVPLALGCARPHGDHRAELDKLALRLGVDAIAFPSEEAVEEAWRLGLKPRFLAACCSQVYLELGEAALKPHRGR